MKRSVLHALVFLFQVSMLLEKSVICWIVLHLALVLVLKCNANAITWKREVCGLIVVMTLPFSFWFIWTILLDKAFRKQ